MKYIFLWGQNGDGWPEQCVTTRMDFGQAFGDVGVAKGQRAVIGGTFLLLTGVGARRGHGS